MAQQTQEFAYDVFLSHNSSDKPTVRELAEELKKRHIKVWLDEEQLVPGQLWQEALEEIIQTVKTTAVPRRRAGLQTSFAIRYPPYESRTSASFAPTNA